MTLRAAVEKTLELSGNVAILGFNWSARGLVQIFIIGGKKWSKLSKLLKLSTLEPGGQNWSKLSARWSKVADLLGLIHGFSNAARVFIFIFFF